MGFRRAIQGEGVRTHAGTSTLGECFFACGRKCGQIAHRSTRSEEPPGTVIAEELSQPRNRLTFNVGRTPGVKCEIGIM